MVMSSTTRRRKYSRPRRNVRAPRRRRRPRSLRVDKASEIGGTVLEIRVSVAGASEALARRPQAKYAGATAGASDGNGRANRPARSEKERQKDDGNYRKHFHEHVHRGAGSVLQWVAYAVAHHRRRVGRV